MQRIYYPDMCWKTQLYIEDSDLIHQIIKVLRMRINDECIFFDGKNSQDFVYKIGEIGKKNILFEQKEMIQKHISHFELHLYQALPNKLEKLEWILQKWVEVGYTKFVFFRSHRSQDLFISESKMTRLQKILIEAVEQSGRNDIPEIIFEKQLDIWDLSGEKYFFHTDSLIVKKLSEISFWEKISVFVWPEWGFDETEIQKFQKNNCTALSLWKNILRTETASIGVGFFISQMQK